MSICDFAGIFSILLKYVTGLGKDELYSKIFMSYYEYEGDPSVLTAYTANKVLKGQKYLDRKGKKFYAEADNYTVLYDDLNERVLPYVSDKFGLCDKIRQLIISDGMNESDRDSLLKYYPHNEDKITDFLTKVIIFSLNRPTKLGAESPLMSERINIPAIPSCKYFCGRKKELQALSEMLETLDKVFVYGVGGIGKSEFVKKFIKDNKSDYTNILFLTYSENLKNTIAGICFREDKSDDKIDDLFTRHMNYLRFMKNDTLIVIDNFDIIPDDDENIDDVMSLNCKLIFTTRSHVGDDYDAFELSEMDTDEIMLIAKAMNISENADTLYRLFTAVHNHTLACELILKLIAKSAYKGEEILFRLMDSNINPNITDKIRRNGKGTATYNEHIRKLFDLFTLSDEQQDTLRLLSLVPTYGIGDTYFKELAGMTDFNAVNDLDEAGLIYHDNGTISVHPLIADVSASELIPDMSNCRVFLNNIICEARHVIDNPTNRIRRMLLLPIADNVITYSDKSGNEEYYIYFINSLCTYAEVFYDTAHMKKFISEVDKYIEKDSPPNLHSVHLMSKAALAKIDNNNSAAINFTLKAAEYINDNEIFPAINIYNNLFRFYMDADDMENAEKYCIKTERLVKMLPFKDNSKPVFLFNISKYYMKKQDYKSARNTVTQILGIFEQTAPDSEEHREALILASEIYHALGDEVTSKVYANLALIQTKQKLLNGSI